MAGVNIRQGAHWLAAVCRHALPDDVVDLLDPACSPVPAEPPIVRLLLGPKLRPQHEKTPGSRSRSGRFHWSQVVVRDRIELSTFRFSGGRSYQLSYLTIGGLTVPPLFPSGPDGI